MPHRTVNGEFVHVVMNVLPEPISEQLEVASTSLMVTLDCVVEFCAHASMLEGRDVLVVLLVTLEGSTLWSALQACNAMSEIVSRDLTSARLKSWGSESFGMQIVRCLLLLPLCGRRAPESCGDNQKNGHYCECNSE